MNDFKQAEEDIEDFATLIRHLLFTNNIISVITNIRINVTNFTHYVNQILVIGQSDLHN